MSKPTVPPTQKSNNASSDSATRKSGRVQFDERGQAIWAWAVETGTFDRNASTQRVRALSESTVPLEIADNPATKPNAVPLPQKGAAFTPYDTHAAKHPARSHDTRGSDPYSRGAAKSPEAVTFNPYDRTPPKRR
ncbi:MAG: hypothetical protein NTZ79_03195 [Proteobacteria bacterium]|nr:hypothetical protein [Pseudomonadota bacterium]